MMQRGQTETTTMDSPLIEFTCAAQPDGSVIDLRHRVRRNGSPGPLGKCTRPSRNVLDRDRITSRAQYGDWYFVSTATAEFVGNVAVMADDQAIQLIEPPDPEADDEPGTIHSIPWDTITRVGIVPAPIDSPGCA